MSSAQQIKIYFPSGSTVLNDRSKQLLSSISVTGARIIEITGHTDTIGTIAYNKKLAAGRIKSVTTYLGITNVPASINVYNKDESHPLQPGHDSLNRCVVISLVCKPETDSTTARQISAGSRTRTLIKQFTIRDLLFLPDKAALDPATVSALNETAAYLLRFKNHAFEIRGHVNYPAELLLDTASALFRLSADRASLVKDMLTDYGIPAASITCKGMGNTELLYPKPGNTDEKMKNMRVEILIYQLSQ
ncbi:OmpA family protein [Chitinophaga solisilvae]|uniref:OmpA family protein n=1 Tax=Chitinophaga solisilvae TaxID=1233460 RepID=UPI00136963B1|nr:OmpA family protein [Chitinophaga solisilvae]